MGRELLSLNLSFATLLVQPPEAMPGEARQSFRALGALPPLRYRAPDAGDHAVDPRCTPRGDIPYEQLLQMPLLHNPMLDAITEASFCSQSARVASAGLTFKHFGEGARSGNAATVATLHLARNQAGGAKSEAFRGTDTMLLFAARARAHRGHCDVSPSTPALERGGAEQLLCI